MTTEEITNILSGKKVAIAGCGGLGSNCAVSLCRVGIGTLVIADFDVVSESNLNRQYYFQDQVGQKKVLALTENIRRINPGVRVIAHDTMLTADNIPLLFADCDVIVEAFDQAGQKEILIETVLGQMPGRPLVAGLGMAGWGMNNSIRYQKTDNLHICGDGVSEISPDLPPLAPRVCMVANMQANTVLEILLEKYTSSRKDCESNHD